MTAPTPCRRNAVIVLDKPPGRPANPVLSELKRLLGRPKAGFLGTLDPLATGVLPVFLNKATKLIPAFEGLDKTYEVTLRLGQRTDTLDAEGTVLEERPLDGVSETRVAEVIAGFQGEREQVPPQHSAVKTGGVPAYRLARQGREAPVKPRRVALWDLEVLEVALPTARFRVTCSAGTYMRSLAEEIGQTLEVGAHVAALRRLRCGRLFTLADSATLESIADGYAAGDDWFLQDPGRFLPEYQALTIGEREEALLRQGRAIHLQLDEGAREATRAKAIRPDGRLVAVGRLVAQQEALGFQPEKVLI